MPGLTTWALARCTPPTKPDAVDVTYDELRRICAAVPIPVVGIGGVDASTAHELSGTGVAGGAVVSAMLRRTTAESAARRPRAEAALPDAMGTSSGQARA